MVMHQPPRCLWVAAQCCGLGLERDWKCLMKSTVYMVQKGREFIEVGIFLYMDFSKIS